MSPSTHDLTAPDRRKRDRSIWGTALLLSVLVHLVVVVAFRSGPPAPPSPFAAAGPRRGDFRAAPGSMHAMNIRTPQPARIIPPPKPIEVQIQVQPVEFHDARLTKGTLEVDLPAKSVVVLKLK